MPQGPIFLHSFLSFINSSSGIDTLPSLCGFIFSSSHFCQFLSVFYVYKYTVLQLCFHWFLCRTDKDSKEYCCQDNSYRISNLRRKSQALFCTEEIGHGNCTHECCRYRCDPVILLLARPPSYGTVRPGSRSIMPSSGYGRHPCKDSRLP